MLMISHNTYFCTFPTHVRVPVGKLAPSTLDNSKKGLFLNSYCGMGEWRRTMKGGTDIKD